MGDLVKRSLLGRTLASRRTSQPAVIRALVVGVTALDAVTAFELARAGRAGLLSRP